MTYSISWRETSRILQNILGFLKNISGFAKVIQDSDKHFEDVHNISALPTEKKKLHIPPMHFGCIWNAFGGNALSPTVFLMH